MALSLNRNLVLTVLAITLATTSLAQGVHAEMNMGETTVIGGVERLQWGQGMENTFIGSLTVVMKSLGEDVTYDYLMGVSGAAFRFHFATPEWCPSSPDATCGFNCADPALAALGYDIRFIHAMEDSPEAPALLQAVVDSIDAGHPVLAIDLKAVPDWGIITGYENGGKKLLCRTYYDESEDYAVADKWPWVVAIIGEKGEPLPRTEALRRSLELAVKLAHTESYDEYASGFAGLERWIVDLEDDARFADTEATPEFSNDHINAWIYYSLMHSRQAAARYLRSILAELPLDAAGHVLSAAETYEEAALTLEQNRQYAPFKWELPEGASWDADMRQAEVAALREVLRLERRAVEKMEAALALIRG